VTRRAAASLALIVLSLLAGPASVSAAEPLARPQPRAASFIVLDARTGDVLFEKGADAHRAIASTTKLMTALLALEESNLDDVFTAPAYRALPAESRINLRKGEKLTVRDLLKALLLESANDAAATIAENVSGSRGAFVAAMNARAREVGLDETRYANPVGLDDPDNYSTARDLSSLATRLMKNRTFARIVDTPRATLTSGSHRRVVANRNVLIPRYDFVDGIKTGRTRRAGYVLVGSASGRGERVISVVLGEPSEAARDLDTLALLRWGVDQFRRVRVFGKGAKVAEASVRWREERVALTAPGNVALTVRRGERVGKRIDAPDEIEGPLAKGEKVGSAQVVYRGKVVRTVPLVTAGEVRGASPARRLTSALGTLLTVLFVLGIVFGAVLVALRIRAVRVRRARMTTGT